MMLIIHTVLIGVASAGGGGMYAETQAGAATTDSTGFIARGVSAGLGFGGYWGTYHSTFRYGKYWQGGGVFTVSQVEPLGQLVDMRLRLGVQITRGVDLMNLGAWWCVTTGPTAVYQSDSLSHSLDIDGLEDPAFGWFVSGALGASYNFSHAVTWKLRYESGLVYDESGFSRISGFGTGLQLRVPFIRRHWRDEE